MLETRVAKRYATALFNLAMKRDVVEEVDEELHQLERVFAAPKLMRFLTHPEIEVRKKREVLNRALAGRVRPAVFSLLELMLRKQRIGEFPAVARYYDLLTDRLRGVEEITVISAVELEDSDYRELLGKMVAHSAYPKLRLMKVVRPEILGGVIIELGRDKVIDASLRTRLNQLHRQLVKYRSI